MKRLILFFVIFWLFEQRIVAQYFDCPTKSFAVNKTGTLKYKASYNTTPIRLVWKKNNSILSVKKNQYSKNYRRLFYSLESTPLPDSQLTHYFLNITYHKSFPFYVDEFNANVYYHQWNKETIPYTGIPIQPNSCYSEYGSSLDSRFIGWTPLFTKIWNKLDSINSEYFRWDSLNSDTFNRSPLQYFQYKDLLYFIDENVYAKSIGVVSYLYHPHIKVRHIPTGNLVDIIRFDTAQYPKRNACNNNNLKFTNFSVQDSLLYLSYSYLNRDSLAIYNLNTRQWIARYKLRDTNSFIYSILSSTDYCPMGNSRIKVSDKTKTIFNIEYLGGISKYDPNMQSKTILYNGVDSTLNYRGINFYTRDIGLDGWDNLYLPDNQSGFIVRWERDSVHADILIDTIMLIISKSSYPYLQYYRYKPRNIQIGCSADIYAEYTPYKSEIVNNPFDFGNIGTFHLYFKSYIEDSIRLNARDCGDTLSITAYFADGDSLVRYIYPNCQYIPLNIIACDSFRLNNKVYYQSGIYYDSIVNTSAFDTFYTLNLIINKTKFDTLKKSSCDSFSYKNNTYKKPNLYTFPYTASNGCDSFHTLSLAIRPSYRDSFKRYSCQPYLFGDSLLRISGVYSHTFKTIYQCDSLVTLDFNIGLNNAVSLTNGINYTALQDNVSYQWYSCVPIWRRIVNETRKTFRTTTMGSYAVVLDDGKGCRDTSDCIALYSASTLISAKTGISIYPNPFSDHLTIELHKPYREIAIKLYDPTGRLILHNNYWAISTIYYPLSTVPVGTYYLQIETDSDNLFYNILKE